MSDSGSANNTLSQASYKGTPYRDSDWEIVGDAHFSEDFTPLDVEVVPVKSGQLVDPMFADFGGIAKNVAERRWHLPEHLVSDSAEIRRRKKEEATAREQSVLEQQLTQAREEAFKKGREQGLEEAVDEGHKKMAELEARTNQLMKDLAIQVREQVARLEKQAVELALEISKKIIDGAVEINPEYVVKTVKEALGLAGGAAIRKVRVSKQDMEFIEVLGVARHLKEFDGSWQFEGDESIKAGCVVETSAGEIDYQLDAAWERIKDSVVKVIR